MAPAHQLLTPEKSWRLIWCCCSTTQRTNRSPSTTWNLIAGSVETEDQSGTNPRNNPSERASLPAKRRNTSESPVWICTSGRRTKAAAAATVEEDERGDGARESNWPRRAPAEGAWQMRQRRAARRRTASLRRRSWRGRVPGRRRGEANPGSGGSRGEVDSEASRRSGAEPAARSSRKERGRRAWGVGAETPGPDWCGCGRFATGLITLLVAAN
jgi:hypothetical protein